APVTALRDAPRPDAARLTEALRGETVRVFDRDAEGWAWGQLAADGYVGWLALDDLDAQAPAPTHRVAAVRTLLFAGPDIKSAPLAGLPLGAAVALRGESEDRNARYGLVAPAGAIVMQHLRPLGAAWETDFVAVAERFLGVPYLWGGKTSLGLDCSGLVQVALAAAGVAAPRDTDMQAAETGLPLPLAPDPTPLRRGDLVFWRGHVGIMQDGERLLHANAHHMAVASEPLREAAARLAAKGSAVIALRRPAAGAQ
ncbi:NlpC/P60 family protein, partial [Propylenella binzhouense]